MTRALALVGATSVAALLAACASAPPLPSAGTAPAFPDFVYPAVTPGIGDKGTIAWHERGWRYLQAGDLRNAEQAFSRALGRTPAFFPSETGLGYVAVARRDYAGALSAFGRALSRANRYAPALVGRGDALLGASRPEEALESLQAALGEDPSLAEIRRRIDVLKLRTVQEQLTGARRAADEGRFDDARAAYEKAIAASPESAFLYRDLASVERRQGSLELALQHARQAVTLDATDGSSWTELGAILDGQDDVEGAMTAYARAAQLDPGPDSAGRLDRARNRAALATLPAHYRRLPEATEITRGDLAAVLGIRLGGLLQSASSDTPPLVTDARGHWAEVWIQWVTAARVMDVFSNHTFAPLEVIRRGDLALAASRVIQLIGRARPLDLQQWQRRLPEIADVPSTHPQYSSVALVVAAAIMPLADDGRFRLSRPVSGAEALEAIGRLEVLGR